MSSKLNVSDLDFYNEVKSYKDIFPLKNPSKRHTSLSKQYAESPQSIKNSVDQGK